MRRYILTLIVFLIAAGTIGYSVYEWQTQKEEIVIQLAEIFDRIALPYRVAQLAGLPRDTALLVPVAGVRLSEVADTWGQARSEGRSHEGTDIFARRGTPVYAATRGYVVRVGENRLGGIIVIAVGPGGIRYYYAHLDRIADGIAFGTPVTTDTVLGFVGNTGNASGTPPHLHFGMYGRSGPENPYPLLVNRAD